MLGSLGVIAFSAMTLLAPGGDERLHLTCDFLRAHLGDMLPMTHHVECATILEPVK